jgi:hypothetical protein
MQRAEIIRYWGRDNLKRWSRDVLRRVTIPESSKSYLVEVGLPFRADWTFQFDDDASRLPQLPNKPSYRRIGFDDPVPICLDEERHGCVVEVGDEFGYPERYFNSSVEFFGECLVYYQQYRLIARGTEDDVPDLVAATERRMRKADPAAFTDEESCWPLIIEQMTYGML